MKHAFLMTAYKNPGHILRIMDKFDERFDFLIHVDKRSKFSLGDWERLKNHPRCRFVGAEYKVFWCGIGHIRSIFYLARKAIGLGCYDYFHVISGQDYPVVTSSKFDEFYAQNPGANFVDHNPLASAGWSKHMGQDRTDVYNFVSLLDAKKPWQSKLAIILRKIQWRIGLRRKHPKGFPSFVPGSLWVSLTADTWRFIVEKWDENKSWERYFYFVFAPEELVLSSLAIASPFAANIRNRSIHLVDWGSRNGSRPAVLDETDFPRLATGDFLFARKVEYPVSESLMGKIDAELLR